MQSRLASPENLKNYHPTNKSSQTKGRLVLKHKVVKVHKKRRYIAKHFRRKTFDV